MSSRPRPYLRLSGPRGLQRLLSGTRRNRKDSGNTYHKTSAPHTSRNHQLRSPARCAPFASAVFAPTCLPHPACVRVSTRERNLRREKPTRKKEQKRNQIQQKHKGDFNDNETETNERKNQTETNKQTNKQTNERKKARKKARKKERREGCGVRWREREPRSVAARARARHRRHAVRFFSRDWILSEHDQPLVGLAATSCVLSIGFLEKNFFAIHKYHDYL